MRQILPWLGEQPSLDRVRDERRDNRGDHPRLIAYARRRKRGRGHFGDATREDFRLGSFHGEA
jgi:hypothetical protein